MEKKQTVKYLIDVGHPAHVHYFKKFANKMQDDGNLVVFTCRDKELVVTLLRHYGFKFFNFGKPYKSLFGKFFGLFYFTFRLFLVAIKQKPDMYINATMYSAFVAWTLRKPHISFEDTYNMEQVRLYSPFTTVILTGDYEHPPMGKKEIEYAGYQELLYLHPNQFTPDKSIYRTLGLSEGEKFVIIRFVSWNASHDIGHKGISSEKKLKAIEEFSKFAKVFISSESELPNKLEKYRVRIEPHRMHDAIAFASLVFGESSTMAEEAAMLGVPSVYIFNNSTFYTTHLEKEYRLMYNYSESIEGQQNAIEKGIEILKSSGLREEWQAKREKMLNDKIDVTAFLVWFIENYPQSAKIMKENPEYQYMFK
ncbi:hypothetical protein DSECCO2_192960 [anaerobic digester metagenome]